MNRAFTLIELMVVISIIAIIAAIAIPALATKKQNQEKPEPAIETDLSSKSIPYIESAKVLVLPTGERVLVLSGSGKASACLLPPLPKKVEVEK